MSWVRRWNVTGSSGTPYVVGLSDSDGWGCSCPAWKFKKAPRPNCKHIEAVRAQVGEAKVMRAAKLDKALGGRPAPTLEPSRFSALDLDAAASMPVGASFRRLDLDITVTQ